MTDDQIKANISVIYQVTAYVEAGYGDNRSKDFTNKAEAIEYCKGLPNEFNPSLTKIISMRSFHIKIDWRVAPKTPEEEE